MRIVDDFCKPLEVYTIASAKLENCYNEINELTKNKQDDVLAEHVSVTASMLPNMNEVLKEIKYQDPPNHSAKGKENLKGSSIRLRKR
jgi:hypothetical protein